MSDVLKDDGLYELIRGFSVWQPDKADRITIEPDDVQPLLEAIRLEYGNSRELEGRIDENKMWVASYKHQIRRLFGNSYVKKSMKLAIDLFNIRVRELESQKEKTNE